jgi:hypothetical protein
MTKLFSGKSWTHVQQYSQIRYLLLGYLPEPHLFTDIDIPVLEEYIRVRTHLGLGFDEMERDNPSTAETVSTKGTSPNQVMLSAIRCRREVLLCGVDIT